MAESYSIAWIRPHFIYPFMWQSFSKYKQWSQSPVFKHVDMYIMLRFPVSSNAWPREVWAPVASQVPCAQPLPFPDWGGIWVVGWGASAWGSPVQQPKCTALGWWGRWQLRSLSCRPGLLSWERLPVHPHNTRASYVLTPGEAQDNRAHTPGRKSGRRGSCLGCRMAVGLMSMLSRDSSQCVGHGAHWPS